MAERQRATPGRALAARAPIVLHIDDSATVRMLVQRLVERRGTGFVGAEDGKTGLEMARLHHPDLILLDVNLPDMSGEKVLERLRLDQATAAIPVVAISAEAEEDAIDRMRVAGASDYVAKPIRVEKLLQTLERFVPNEMPLDEEAADTEIRSRLADLVDAQERMREELAAAIHDEPMQVLTALHLGLQLLGAETRPEREAELQELQEIAQRGIEGLRRFESELRPPSLIIGGLGGVLKNHLESLDASYGGLVDDRLSSEPSAEIATIAYRVVQEVVAALQHAGYACQGLRLEGRDRSIVVDVLVADASKGDSDALRRITSSIPARAWVGAAGGTLDIAPDQDGIVLRLPYRIDARSADDDESLG